MKAALEVESDAELCEPRTKRPVAQPEVGTAEDRLCARIGVGVVGVQEIEDVEDELQMHARRQHRSLGGSEIPRGPGRLMIREQRQQLPVDDRPVRLKAAVGDSVAVEIGGTVQDRKSTR